MNDFNPIHGLFWYLAFLFSTTCHEAAHAWVALKGGDPTAYEGGQVSLSPWPHMRREPIGMLVVPILTALTQGWAIGWASVPFDPEWEERHPHRAALMAAAGPAANLLIALLAFAGLKLGLILGGFDAPSTAHFDSMVEPAAGGFALDYLAHVLSILLTLNVLLAVFNLLPLPPLDGAAVLGLFVSERAAHRLISFARTPGFSMIGLIVAWQVFPHFADPLFSLVLNLLHPHAHYR